MVAPNLAVMSLKSLGAGRSQRGAYMITATPTRQINAPVTSQRSGRKPSIAMPHSNEPATNTPP